MDVDTRAGPPAGSIRQQITDINIRKKFPKRQLHYYCKAKWVTW